MTLQRKQPNQQREQLVSQPKELKGYLKFWSRIRCNKNSRLRLKSNLIIPKIKNLKVVPRKILQNSRTIAKRTIAKNKTHSRNR